MPACRRIMNTVVMAMRRGHPTFSTLLAPSTNLVQRWQQCMLVFTALMGMLTIDIWCLRLPCPPCPPAYPPALPYTAAPFGRPQHTLAAHVGPPAATGACVPIQQTPCSAARQRAPQRSELRMRPTQRLPRSAEPSGLWRIAHAPCLSFSFSICRIAFPHCAA